jgi:hypothetical protein
MAKKRIPNMRKKGLKSNGKLARGYRFAKGGRIVKAGCITRKRNRVCSTRRPG